MRPWAMQARAFSAAAALPSHVAVPMPSLSPTMTSGTVGTWRKKEGDALNPGDVICEVETDKATVDFEVQDSGYLARILVSSGTAEVQVGKPVAIMVDSLEAVEAFKSLSVEAILAALGGSAPAPPAAAPKPAPPAPAPAAPAPAPKAAAPVSAPAPSTGGRVAASPLAKKIAADAGVALASVAGTGPNGRIVAADVKEYMAAPKPAAAVAAVAPTAAAAAAAPAAGPYEDIPHTQMRRVIAQRLTASKQSVPHYYLTIDVNLDPILALRASLNADLPAEQRISVNDFFIKAAALALRKVPEVNSSWLDSGIRAYDYVDISVAVAVPDGLMTPIVKGADKLGLGGISASVKALAEKAKTRQLKPDEYQGGTFTISNLGMFGVRSFSAIVNPPQAAILAIGAADRRVVPDTTEGAASPFKQSIMVSTTLSCYHRVVDGAVGAQWLASFRSFLENPNTMLL